MLPAATLVHQRAARLRLRVPSRKKDQAYFEQVREALAECPGVSEVSANPLTGSILVLHMSETPQILTFAEEKGLFRVQRDAARPQTYPHAVGRTFNDMDARVRRLSGGDLTLPNAISAGLLLNGLLQIARGNFVAPAWYTAFWYGSNVFLKSIDKQSVDREGANPEK